MIKLSTGNRKTGQGLWIFSLPAQSTCIGSTTMCRKRCYAMKAQRIYPNVRNSREQNLQETFKDSFVNDLTKAINTNKFITYFRIHEAGDFYSQEYLDKWIEIAEKHPRIKFLAFTKNFDIDYSKAPDNLKIVISIFPDSPEIPKRLKYLPG